MSRVTALMGKDRLQEACDIKLTVFIVTKRGRLPLFRACCLSVLKDLPDQCEVIVIVNGADPMTEKWLSSVTDSRVSWMVVPAEPRTVSRNRAFTEAWGDIIYFLDDDVLVPPQLFRRVLTKFSLDSELAVLGGPNITPPDSTFQEKLFGGVMTSAFAAPMVRKRYGTTWGRDFVASERDLILCNLAVRQSMLPKGLRFQSRLRSNEENLFLFKCRKKGMKIIHSSELFVFHYRRKNIKGFAQQVFSYGVGRAQQTCVAPFSLHGAFLVPAVVCILGLLLLGHRADWIVMLTAIHGVLSVMAALGAPEILRLGWRGVLGSVPLTLLVHLAYGLGFWWGMLGSLSGWFKMSQVQPPVIQSHERSHAI